MELVYLSGAITTNPNHMKDFAVVEEKLKADGYKVINPAKILDLCDGVPEDSLMKIAIELLSQCDTVYMMDGWQLSFGATMECNYAERCNKRIIYG